MNKSGSSSFLPTYNLKNQYAALPSGTPSYSSNGNVNNDGFHSYYWDSEGKNVKLDANVTMTYDALGRWVERNNTTLGQIYQGVYAPDGSEAAVMRGSTIIAFYVHMPMGAAAVYGYNGQLYTYCVRGVWGAVSGAGGGRDVHGSGAGAGSERFADVPGA